MKKVLFLVAITLSLITIISCKSDEKNESQQISLCTDEETEINCEGYCQEYLCDGSDSGMFMPFNVLKKWRISGLGLFSTSFVYTYIGTETINSKRYYKVKEHRCSHEDFYIYYRVNADGEVFIRENYDSNDYLLVSETKDIGYEWTKPDTNESYKITSKNASIETPICSYSGLIEIEVYKNSDLSSRRYFKKGLGFVCEKTVGSITKYLKNIELQ